MKLKEAIELLEKIEFVTFAPIFEGTTKVGQQETFFGLSSFGNDSYGNRRSDALVIKFRNEKLEFSSCHSLKLNEDLMNREVIKIEKIILEPYINKSSTGNKYGDMYSCQLIIAVE